MVQNEIFSINPDLLKPRMERHRGETLFLARTDRGGHTDNEPVVDMRVVSKDKASEGHSPSGLEVIPLVGPLGL